MFCVVSDIYFTRTKALFPQYVLTVEWNCIASDVQHTVNYIRDLDIDLGVYYTSNGTAIYL